MNRSTKYVKNQELKRIIMVSLAGKSMILRIPEWS